MAKAKKVSGKKEKPTKVTGVQKPEFLKSDASTSIVSTVRLEEIKLKDLCWLVKLRIGETLPKAYHQYKIIMELDETPYLERIEDLENQVRGSLFEHDAAQRKEVDRNIELVRQSLEERRKECERMQFNATVEELKYKDAGTTVTVRVPDDIIEAFNRQKTRFGYYQITLESIYG